MRCRSTSTFALAASFITATTPGMLAAQSSGLEDMVGARAGQAEGELDRRGYRNVGGEQSHDRSYTFWWNADRRQCVTIVTMNGRYDSITPSLAPDCRQSADTRPRPDYGNRPQPDYRPGNGYPRPPYQPGGDRPAVLPSRTVVDGQAVELGLVCFGDGSRDGLTSGTRWNWNDRNDRYEPDRYMEGTREVFDAAVTVQTWPGGGRIRLPRSLVPPLNSRGRNGWWDLTDVSIGPDVIRASYRLNGLNRPRMVINRRSGRITIQGAAEYGFRGSCDLIGDRPRRF